MRYLVLVAGVIFVYLSISFFFQPREVQKNSEEETPSDLFLDEKEEKALPTFSWLEDLDKNSKTSKQVNLFNTEAPRLRIPVENFGIGSDKQSLGIYEGPERIGPGAFTRIGPKAFAVLDTNNQRVLIKNGNLSEEILLAEGESPRGITSRENGSFDLLVKENNRLVLRGFDASGNMLDEMELENLPKELLHYAGGIHIFPHENENYIENFGNIYRVENNGHLEKVPGVPVGNHQFASFQKNKSGTHINILDENNSAISSFPINSNFDSFRTILDAKNHSLVVVYDHVEKSESNGKVISTPTKVIERYDLEGDFISGAYLDHNENVKIDQDFSVAQDGKIYQLKAHKGQFLLMEVSI